MTREEAIAIFKGFKFLPREMKAVDMAIKALQQEPCEDAVSRAEVKNKAIQIWNGDGDEDYKFSTLIDYITDLPPVTPTHKKGKWIKVTGTEFGVGYKCSECGRFILTESLDGRKLKDYPYCHCGAEMRESEE